MNTRSRSNSNARSSSNGGNSSGANNNSTRPTRRRMAGNSNTGPIFYFSNRTVKAACKRENEAIRKHCDDEKEKSREDAKRAKAKNSKLGALSDRIQHDLESIEGAIKAGYSYKRSKD